MVPQNQSPPALLLKFDAKLGPQKPVKTHLGGLGEHLFGYFLELVGQRVPRNLPKAHREPKNCKKTTEKCENLFEMSSKSLKLCQDKHLKRCLHYAIPDGGYWQNA